MSGDSAEKIARLVNDFESGRAVWAYGDEKVVMQGISDLNVIDATAFAVGNSGRMMSIHETDISDLFEDVRPPFDNVLVAFDYSTTVKTLGVIQGDSVHFCSVEVVNASEPKNYNDVANSQWSLRIMTGDASFYGGKFRTVMPRTIWGVQLDDNGKPVNVYRQVNPILSVKDEDGRISGAFAMIENFNVFVTLSVFNMANCANVSLAEPRRSRPQRRRIERQTKTAITNLVIEGSRKRSQRASEDAGDSLSGHVPLHTVRGHVAHYGACCDWHEPRGLLFGKLTKRVWVPAHARGDIEAGEREHTYTVKP